MKLLTILLSSLLIVSPCVSSAGDNGVYYAELNALKKAAKTKTLFEQDIDGGSHTNQCNLVMYRPISCLGSDQDLGGFTQLDDWRRYLSLGNLKRQIMISKELSFIESLLITGLCDLNDDLIIVTPETMPALYSYVSSLAEKADIPAPSV